MRNSKGFSLIEVLVAMMIFAGSLLVINNIWSSNLVRIRKARSMNEATLLLQSKMTEYEILYKNTKVKEIPENESGDFEGYPNYSWTMESREFEMPDISSAIQGEDAPSDPMLPLLVKTMTEFINKAVKEVKVSILIKGLSKESKPVVYSATTLFVDYDQEISIPGIGGGGGGSSDEGGDE